MKRLFRKDNRIARFVAMWLVFIMALTPLYEHSGLKNPTKAATAYLSCPTISVSVDGKYLKKTDNGDTTFSFSVPSAFEGDNVDKSMATEVHYYGDDVAAVNFSASLANSSAVYAVTTVIDENTSETKEYQIASSNFAVMGKKYGENADIPTQITDTTNALVGDNSASADEYYAVYVKVNSTFTYKNTDNVAVIEEGSGNVWTLQKLYKVVKDTSFINDSKIWKQGETSLTSGAVAQSPFIDANTVKETVEAEGNIYLGDILYSYAEYQLNQTNIWVYKNNNKLILADSETVPAPSSFEEGKAYIAWVSYSDGTNKSDVSTGSYVIVDDTDPIMDPNKSTTIHNYSENKTQEAEDGVYYLDKSQNFKVTFYTQDANPEDSLTVKCYEEGATEASKTKTFTLDENSNGAQSYFNQSIISELTVGTTYELKVVLTDKAQNDVAEEKSIAKICVVDKTFTIKYDIDGVVNGKLVSPCKTQQVINATITSGEELGSVGIYYDTNKEIDSVSIEGLQPKGGIYTYNYTYTLPANTYSDVKYDNNIKIKATEKDGTEESEDLCSKTYYFDVNDPKVSSAVKTGIDYSFGSIAEDEWTLITTDMLDETTDGFTLLDSNTSDFKIEVTVSDGENGSGIKSVTAYTDDTMTVKIGDLENTDSIGTYSLEITNANLKKILADNGGVLAAYVHVEDGVERTASKTLVPTIVAVNQELIIEEGMLTYSGTEKAVDITKISEGAYDYNNQYTLKLKVTSPCYITDVYLTKVVDGVETTFIQKTNLKSQNVPNNLNGRKTLNIDISIPDTVTGNELLEDVKVYVVDDYVDVDNGTTSRTKDAGLGDLLYDASEPEITVDGAGAPFVDDVTWYKPEGDKKYIEALVEVTPGSQAVESKLDTVTYSIDNSKSNKADSSDDVSFDGEKTKAQIKMKIPESKDASGTKITVNAKDTAENGITNNNVIIRKVDATEPSMESIAINGDKNRTLPVGPKVEIKATAKDNLGISKIVIQIYKVQNGVETLVDEDEETYAKGDVVNKGGDSVTKTFAYTTDTLADGDYKIVAIAYDKTETASQEMIASFIVDDKAPVLNAKILTPLSGKVSGYYNDPKVKVEFTCVDKSDTVITVKDSVNNGAPVEISKDSIHWTEEDGKVTGTFEISKDGAHNITIEAYDCGPENKAKPANVYFVRDTDAPEITAVFNRGTQYNGGEEIFRTDTLLAFTENELNKSEDHFYYQLTKEVPDDGTVTGQSKPTSVRSFTYTDEAIYTVQVYSEDKANNRSATKTVTFKIDKTSPNISIGGIASGGTSSTPIVISLTMQDVFWREAECQVEISVTKADGSTQQWDPFTFNKTGRTSVNTEEFRESGVYRIVFRARDGIEQDWNTITHTFTIDTTAPKVTLSGVSNFDVTDQNVTIESVITEDFYTSKKINISGTVTDETGKVTPIVIDDYSQNANPTTISKTFSADGIYDLTISCVDVAGNSDSKSVHFIIDKSKPIIGDLSDIDGKILTSFEWNKDLDELVSDLTVCDVHMYLNGQEYNGEDAVEDGSYILLITAEDELGHKVEKEAKFTLDTKAPVFIVTGVEDDEKRIEPYNISVSLQLDEDTLTEVTLNGEVITINGDTATFDVTEIGEYKLYMEAVDEAGNVSSAEYEFELESENQFNFWWIIGILALLAILIFIIILVKKNKDKK